MNHVCNGPSKTELTKGFDDDDDDDGDDGDGDGDGDDDELHRCVWKWCNTVDLKSEITVCTVAGREASAPLALQPFGSSGLDRNSIVGSLKPTCPCVVLHTVLAVGDWDNHIITFFIFFPCNSLFLGWAHGRWGTHDFKSFHVISNKRLGNADIVSDAFHLFRIILSPPPVSRWRCGSLPTSSNFHRILNLPPKNIILAPQRWWETPFRCYCSGLSSFRRPCAPAWTRALRWTWMGRWRCCAAACDGCAATAARATSSRRTQRRRRGSRSSPCTWRISPRRCWDENWKNTWRMIGDVGWDLIRIISDFFFGLRLSPPSWMSCFAKNMWLDDVWWGCFSAVLVFFFFWKHNNGWKMQLELGLWGLVIGVWTPRLWLLGCKLIGDGLGSSGVICLDETRQIGGRYRRCEWTWYSPAKRPLWTTKHGEMQTW